MGILNTLSKNPTLIAFGALAIGLFIFRDKISGFFSDITGGAETAAEIGETVGVLNENLLGNLKGIQDILSGDIFKDFKFPELPTIELPTFDFSNLFGGFFGGNGGGNGQDMPTDPSDFTETGMAAARARQEPKVLQDDISSMFDITNPQGLIGDIAKAIVPETQAEFQERASGLAETFSDVFRSTSLPGSEISFGRQLSRESEDFESVLASEARRSEEIFAKLFGNVQNPNF